MSATLDRIRKLLNLADNAGASESEADTARRLAERLMGAAGLSEAEVRDAMARGEDPAATVDVTRGVSVNRRQWAGILAVAVSRVVGCTVYRSTMDGCLRWVGTEDQRASAVELHAWLMRQVETLAKGANRTASTRGGRAWMSSYRAGVANAIAAKALEMRKAQQAAAPVDQVALVAMNRVQAAIKAKLPRLVKARSTRIHDEGAFAAGRHDGSTVQLRRAVTLGKDRMLGAGAS